MSSGLGLKVKRGGSHQRDEVAAARELAAAIANAGAALAIFFASPIYDPDRLAREVALALYPVPAIGCTTAGEIGPAGFTSGSVVGMTLEAEELRIGLGLGLDITRSAFRGGSAAVRTALGKLDSTPASYRVGMCLVDGRSQREESFVAGLAAAAPEVPMVGGSASDELQGRPRARVFYDGEAWADCGLVAVFDSEIPLRAVKTEHMSPTDDRVVVTSASPNDRVVHELNGRPASEVFAELIGARGPVDNDLAGRNPFALYIGGQPYVRSVMAVEGTSLRFACAIDKGAVLRPMVPGDMLAATRQSLGEIDRELGGIQAMVAFNCLGRFLESEALGTTAQIGEILAGYPLIGFNTFGEQYNALHVNHTFTALAFGGAEGVSRG